MANRQFLVCSAAILTLVLIGCPDEDPVTTADTVSSTAGDTTEGGTTGDTTTAGGTTEGDTTTGGGTTDEGETTGEEPSKPKCVGAATCFNGDCCTCAPAPKCQEGIDNALSGLAGLANGPLQGSVDDGSVSILAEFTEGWDSGNEFTLNMYTGAPTPDTACAIPDFDLFAETVCDWTLKTSAFTSDCKPLISFSNAKIDGTTFTAGGDDGVFELNLPIVGFELKLVVTRARIIGTATITDGKITAIDGILGGAIPKQTLRDAIDAIPEEDLPIDKGTIEPILDSILKEDIDGLDCSAGEDKCVPGEDGIKESVSVSLIFKGNPSVITGVVMPEATDEGGTTDAGDTTEGDTTEGGTTEGETTEGGTTGTTEGETTEGGTTEAATTEAGTTEAGTTEAGTTDGGADTGGGTGDSSEEEHDVCTEYPTTFSPVVIRLYELQLGESGKPGQGLDIDGLCRPVVEVDDEFCPASEDGGNGE